MKCDTCIRLKKECKFTPVCQSKRQRGSTDDNVSRAPAIPGTVARGSYEHVNTDRLLTQNWSLSLGDELNTVGFTTQTSTTGFKPYIQGVPTADLNLSAPVIGLSPDLDPWQLPSSSVSQLRRCISLESATPAYEDWSPIELNMLLNKAGGDDMCYDS
ncbi:hypothetical protein VE03_10418 [Pseudogymnoascus sp. 23342-1-I1]|nr:hypothetical protein VE03_10418 [Pseudogymnoascus sp. 23342-1-I1]